MKNQILNTIEITKDNFRQWNALKLNEVAAGIITNEQYEEMKAKSEEMTKAQINHLEKQLQELASDKNLILIKNRRDYNEI